LLEKVPSTISQDWVMRKQDVKKEKKKRKQNKTKQKTLPYS
jgi:hypothetical protein